MPDPPESSEPDKIPNRKEAGRAAAATPTPKKVSLTSDTVEAIRRKFRNGATVAKLVEEFGVSSSAIYKATAYQGSVPASVNSSTTTPRPPRVALPRSSDHKVKPMVYVRIVKDIKSFQWGVASFEGKIYAPGGVIDLKELLPEPCVAIECAGPIGLYKKGTPREFLYIAWRFDFRNYRWFEVARAQSVNASWTGDLRPAVSRILHPEATAGALSAENILKRSGFITEALLKTIDDRLITESPEVQSSVLSAMYERLAGRIAASASNVDLSAALAGWGSCLGPGRAESADGKDTSPKKVLEAEAG